MNHFLRNRLGRLVRVTTEISTELTGFHFPADKVNAPTLLYIHGLSGGADTSFVFELLSLEEGSSINVLLTNNSGRANLTITRQGNPLVYHRTGSAFERFKDCLTDIRAWINLAQEFSSGPVVLMGHSLGASKVTHYLGTTHARTVFGVILASPADVPGGFIEKVGIDRFNEFLKMAKKLVAEEKPDALMPEDCVIGILGHLLSAGTFLDRFDGDGPADTFDFFGRGAVHPFQDLAEVCVPIMVLYSETGELVGDGGVTGAIESLRTHAKKSPFLDSIIVQGDHWYRGNEIEVMSQVLRWVKKVTNGKKEEHNEPK